MPELHEPGLPSGGPVSLSAGLVDSANPLNESYAMLNFESLIKALEAIRFQLKSGVFKWRFIVEDSH
jgi:hypothetical protein